MGFLTAWVAGLLEIIVPGRRKKDFDKASAPSQPSSVPSGAPEHPPTVEI
jgi:hypothetical protein